MGEMKPKVSVIVPIYNGERYLHRCINSIINQSLKEIEIILVDDESSDNCPSLCEEYAEKDERIIVIHKKNEGVGYARNSGLNIARGEYVGFVDFDDYVSSDMFEKLYTSAQKNNADIVFCDYYEDNGKKIKPVMDTGEKVIKGEKAVNNYLLEMVGEVPSYHKDFKHLMTVWHGIYSKKIINENNIRFCSERKYISEDIMFHIDIIPKTDVICKIDDPLYFYCYNEKSLSRQVRYDRFKKDLILYYELNNRLSKLFNYDMYYLRTQRFLLARARVSIMQIINCARGLSKDERKERIFEIIDNNEIEKICRSYPIKQLPFHHRMFVEAVKNKDYFKILLLVKVKKVLSAI